MDLDYLMRITVLRIGYIKIVSIVLIVKIVLLLL